MTPGALTPEMEEMFLKKITHFFEGQRAGIHKATIRSFGERFVGHLILQNALLFKKV